MTIDGAGGFRQRLLDGLAASIDERGYHATKIDDIVRFAKTSKRTFYAEFGSKKECYLEAVGRSLASMGHTIEAAVDPTAPWRVQVRQAVCGYLESAVAHPGMTLSGIRDLPIIDVHGRNMQRQTMESLADLLFRLGDVEVFREAGIEPLGRQPAIILLGGIREIVASTIEDGKDVMALADVIANASIAMLELSQR